MKRLFALLALTLCAACGNGENNDPMSTNNKSTNSMSTNNTSTNNNATNNNATNNTVATNGSPCGDAPERIIAGTAETDPLAADLSTCGQASFAWLDDEQLGDVTGWGTQKTLTTTVLNALASTAGVQLPRPLEHDAVLKQYAYMTQDRGQLVEVTAFAAFPTDVESDGPRDVVLLTHGFSGNNDNCALSNNTGWQTVAGLIASYGYIVVAPDYIGMKGFGEPSTELAPSIIGSVTATTSLDAVRAAFKMTPAEREGLCVSNRVAVVGPSQGGHAALFTELVAPYYARELEIVGGSAGVPAGDFLHHTEYNIAAGGSRAYLTGVILSGFVSWYDYDPANLFIPPFDESAPEAFRTECNTEARAVFGEATVDEMFTAELVDAARNGTMADLDPIGCMLSEQSILTTSIQRIDAKPMLFVVGSMDETLDPGVQRNTFDEMCAGGAELTYLECTNGMHVSTNTQAFDSLVDFVDARFAGEEPTDTCVRSAAVDCEL